MSTHDGTASEPRISVLAGYLALGMGIGPLTHYALSALGPMVVSDLDLSATEFGGLWLVAFGAAAVCTPGFGRLTDRVGARHMLRLVFASSAAAMVLVGVAQSLVLLVLGVAFAGVAIAISNPATNLAVASSVRPGRQGVVVGVKQSGVQGSQLVAGLALPGLAVLMGWRGAVLLCALLAVPGLLLARRAVAQTVSPRPRGAEPRSAMDSSVWWLTACALLTGATVQATNVYLPLYAHDELNYSVREAGLVAAVLGGTGVLARLAWGRAMDRIPDVQLLLGGLAVASGVGLAACGMAAAYGAAWVWVGAAIFGASALAANVVVMMAVVRNASTGAVGRATGWISLGLYTGFMVGPVSFGAIVDSSSGYGGAWSVLCGLAALMAVLAVSWKRFGGPDEHRRSGTSETTTQGVTS